LLPPAGTKIVCIWRAYGDAKGSFERSLRLPDSIDESKVDARFDKGVLKVTCAKKPEAVKAERRIEIKKSS